MNWDKINNFAQYKSTAQSYPKMNFKKASLVVAAMAISSISWGQRTSLAYIDSDYILGRMPEYQSAQQELNDKAAEWELEAVKKESALTQLQKDFAAEEILLTSEQRKQKKQSISDLEKDLMDFRQEKFGTDGELFKKRVQLVKPIQDKLFDAVQKVAKQEGLDYVFDKASGVQMLYANPKYDKTFEVMEELGIPLTENETQKTNKP